MQSNLPVSSRPLAVATRPASSYDPEPPYRVYLEVHQVGERQPGWLKIMELFNESVPATCTGEFPEKNRLLVQTNNVRQLRIYVSQLPIAARKRIILKIDDQGLELAHKQRDYVLLERRTTGEWMLVK